LEKSFRQNGKKTRVTVNIALPTERRKDLETKKTMKRPRTSWA
jgi:hypothetical protein